jgi:quercetin dioxygenase-like cupin family protein
MSRLITQSNLFRAGLLLAALAGLPASPAMAQAQGLSTKPLLRSTVSGDDGKEVVTLSVELAPGGTTGRHTHPGDEYATLLQGTLEIRAEGQEPRRVHAGEAYHNPRGVIHETRNVGDEPARSIATFVLDKGKPVAIPAP